MNDGRDSQGGGTVATGPVPDRPGEGPVPRPSSAHVLDQLSNGEIEVKGRIPWSSNATFLVSVKAVANLAGEGEAMLAIYKPAKGERPLWDFPRGLWRREVAAYELAVHLGWDMVPPTVARDGPAGQARCSSAWTHLSTSTTSLCSAHLTTIRRYDG